MLPKSVTLSKVATDKFRNLKGVTGVTPNVLARIAMMLALKDGGSLKNASVADSNGQQLNRDVLFGENEPVYEVLINQYVHDTGLTQPLTDIIAALIEAGVHKMGHAKSLADIARLGDAS